MNTDQIWNEVMRRYDADKQEHPNFPDHVCGQASMVASKAGSLLVAAVEKKYHAEDKEALNPLLESSLLDTIVQAIRFLENLK